MTKSSDERPNPVSRRTFISGTGAAIGGALLATPTLASKQADCKVTPADVLGPFYRFGAPAQTQLAGPDEPGQRLILSGTVYTDDCRTPIPGAFIEVWQANDAGVYDTSEPGNFTEHNDFHMRAVLQTNAKGQYEIETVVPGRYPIPPGLPGLESFAGHTRPAHVHFRVIDSLTIPLTTQLYFKGDPHLAKDPWARAKPDLAIELKTDGKLKRGVFNIVLGRGR